MSYSERILYWNSLYERAPKDLRFNIIIWGLVVIGVINMILTIAISFPLCLLVVLAIAALAAIRVPYLLGWVTGNPTAGLPPAQLVRLPLQGSPGLYRLNVWYDAQPDERQTAIITGTLLLAGALNWLLTISIGFPFALLFLLVLLAMVGVRYAYNNGYLKPPVEDVIVPAHQEIIPPLPKARPAAEPPTATAEPFRRD